MAGSRTFFEVPRHLSDAFRSLVVSRGATAFMGYLALFSTLLHRYSGEVDIVIGTPVSNRWHAELRRMLGFLLNSLAIRIDFRGNPTFDETLASARSAVLGALEHGDIPYGSLIETLDLERDTSRNPIFQVCLIYLEGDPDAGWFAGMQTEAVGVNNSGARFDLTLALKDTGDAVGGYLEYPTDVWDSDSIAEIIDHLLRLLHSVTDEPAWPVWRHELSSPEQRQTIVAGWGAGRTVSDSPETVLGLFEKQAIRSPADIAVVTEGRSDEDGASDPWEDQLTYAELDARASRFATVLTHAGVRPGDVVAVCLDRSTRLLVAVLGVWKAGGAYLPLDPTAPHARSAGIVHAARVDVVVLSTDAGHTFPDGPWQTIAIDDRHPGDRVTTGPGEPVVSPDALAYVMYHVRLDRQAQGRRGQSRGGGEHHSTRRRRGPVRF